MPSSDPLPGDLRAAIEARTGQIVAVAPASAGNHADVTATLHTESGQVFVKAARKLIDADGPEVKSLRWEAAINSHVTEFAPRLLWKVEAGGWLALGFEHVTGRHADYTPGSPDLELLAKVVHTLQSTPCPDVLAAKRIERRWTKVAADVTPFAGDTLLHADLNPANLLITTDGAVRLVDWAFVARGAAFLEMALLVPWLLKAGHTPAEAERWVARFPAWAAVPPGSVDSFAHAFAEKWVSNLAAHGRAAWAVEHCAAARRWAEYRHRTSRS
ncbi:phosphotransferase [Spirillospora albida]|uniref:phosphotransferase n=1 Tax=Spirillospora albida TaxID=58123 RepID=UPI00068C8778|nr:phosphotransferase [Spirillospora albida]